MKELEDFFKKFMLLPISDIFVAIFIVVAAVIINKLIISKVINVLRKLAKNTNNRFDDNLIKAIDKPLKTLVLFIGFGSALKYLNISTVRFTKVSVVIVLCFLIYNLTLENSLLYSRMHRRNRENTIVFPFVAIVIRIGIIILGISIIAKEFGFTGFLTGLGISGVAFALAAQDTFSNLFGGIVIVLDKPFSIGDWIQAADIEGIVEEITFRSTKLRTFSKAIVTVPNSKLANSNIINWTQRGKRRIHFKFTLDYKTPVDKIKLAIKEIEELLGNHDNVDKELIIVSFNEFAPCGFGIFIYFYTDKFDYRDYEKMKEVVNLEILKLLQDNDIKIAFMNFNLNNNIPKINDLKNSEVESIENITEEERNV